MADPQAETDSEVLAKISELFMGYREGRSSELLNRAEFLVAAEARNEVLLRQNMNLFQLGKFHLHAGRESEFKIECEALTDDDLNCIAYLLSKRLPSFGSVEGIPQGGIKLAEKLAEYVTQGPLLIVDDVLTTGTSMRDHRQQRTEVIGAVIFAREGKMLPWVTSLFVML